MKLKIVFLVSVLCLLFTAQSSFASTGLFDLYVSVPKAVYGPGDMIELYGGLYNSTTLNSTSTFTGVPNASIGIQITDSEGNISSNYALTTDGYGSFHSKNNYINGTPIYAPSQTGSYIINAAYDDNGTQYMSAANITVTSSRVDEIRVKTDKSVYYPDTAIGITIEAVRTLGDYRLPVANITINGTIRDSSDTVTSSFACTTDINGKCEIADTSSEAGYYIIEANNYIGYTTFMVVPFEVDVYIKDDTGKNIKQTFSPGQSGSVEVRASYNGTSPTGTFTATGYIYDSSGTLISTISSFSLNTDNSYINRASFTISSSAAAGTYTARVTVRKTGDGTVNGSASYEVKQWELSASKTGTNNGFEYGYTAFRNATVYFKADVIDLANITTITGLENSFVVSLKNSLGENTSNSTASYNSSLDDYLFNLTLPDIAGAYTLFVSVTYSGETQTITRTITVTDTSAAVIPSDSEGSKKDLFTTSEFVYLKVTARNSNSEINITDSEIAAIRYEDGTETTYSQRANCTGMNTTDATYEWCWDQEKSMITLDPPKIGGLFTADVYANNRTVSASGSFIIKPYSICVSAKASEDSTTMDYYWQFKNTDIVYLLITLTRAQETSGLASGEISTMQVQGTPSGGGYGAGMYGKGSRCEISNTESPIEGASITIAGVINMQNGKSETLNATTSICKSTTSNGKAAYLCTLEADDSKWDGGRYYAILDISGPDGVTKDTGYSSFEARSFYIYGWPNSWQNKPTSNITLTVSMYSAGSGWFTAMTSGGLSGSATLKKITYLGSGWGDWMNPADYEYSIGNPSTITNGAGNITLDVSLTSNNIWKSGMYTATIEATDSASGDKDYGEIWFEVRNWYAWAQPVDTTTSPYQYKWQVNTQENVSLYVKISNAADSGMYYYNSYNQTLGGNVTIGIKKIEYYTTWPPKELPQANYTANTLTVDVTNCDLWQIASCTGIDASKYIINITPSTGRWPSGYYNVMLDINSTETGWGWYSALSFYVSTQPTDVNGTSVYTTKGNGPMYLNVTSTKSQKWGYSSSTYYDYYDYVNTTFEDIVLRRWDTTSGSGSGSWREVLLNYPEDIDVSVIGNSAGDRNITGIGRLNITYPGSAGSWPSGYYSGEVTLANAEGDTGTGWIWFNVEPFRVNIQSSDWEIMQNDNITARVTINEPDWSSNTQIPGNYTITQVIERTWAYTGEHTTLLNYTPASFEGSNTTLTILPPFAGWTNGYKSLTITVKDMSTNTTKEGWLSVRIVPFRISISSLSGYSVGLTSNMTLNISLTNPKTSAQALGNISGVYTWGTWPSYEKQYYRFTAGNCTAQTTGSCTINGTQSITISPPAGGWSEGYNYLQFIFTTTTDTTPIDDWSGISFEAKPPINGYMYAVDSNGYYIWAAGNTSNITLYLYSIQDNSWNPISVNITGIQYYRSTGYWVDERSRTYSDINTIAAWSVINITTGQATGSNEINSNGYIKLVPTGVWADGEYYIKISLSTQTDTGTIKSGSTVFKIKDMTPIIITVNSPQDGATTNASYIIFNATTSKRATCSLSIYNYGDTYYYGYLSQYSGYSYAPSTPVITGETSHIFNYTTDSMPDQAYNARFDCNDYDWNYATTTILFGLNKTSPASNSTNTTAITYIPEVSAVTLSPASPTVSDTLRCNVTATSSNSTNIAVNIKWYNNGNEITGLQNISTVLNETNTEVSSVSTNLTIGINLTAGDVWKCSVRATTNMINYSAWSNSSSVVINSSTTTQSGPQYASNITMGSAIAGNTTYFTVYWYDDFGLSGYIYSTNLTGTWLNDSWTSMSGTANWSNTTKYLNTSAGTYVGWKVYANDTDNLWNATDTMEFQAI